MNGTLVGACLRVGVRGAESVSTECNTVAGSVTWLFRAGARSLVREGGEKLERVLGRRCGKSDACARARVLGETVSRACIYEDTLEAMFSPFLALFLF